ncbi:efflux RND transporter periplasmic adaptor subunit [Devosia sp. 1566]|uniref:efflux RND transporter periplasmic adaptor subunit n=1 Tax=Devosia sp. 1566 TaxID=2499144 RepID=UPI000FD85A87|nr:efflux RND transporter periplasmic adaptor subunit [Devosia sp. 1566]
MTGHTPKPEWAQSKRERDNAARETAGLKPRRRLGPWIVLALLVLGGVGYFLWMRAQPAPVEQAPVAEAAEPVMQLNPLEITQVEPQTLQQLVKVTGSLAPQRQTQLGSQVAGRVVAVLARPGDTVNEGDVLMQLDTESLQIQLDQQTNTAEATRAQLQLAESQLARTTDLIQRGLSASSGLEEAQSSVDALRANLAALEGQVEAARIAVQNATLRASMSGIISERAVEPGQTVQPGTPLFTIVDLSQMEMDAAAPVGASSLVAAGQPVLINVEGFGDRTFDGTVDRVNPVAVAGTRTIPVYIGLDNPDGLLRGGMFATGQIVVAEAVDALAVPTGAVREDAEGFFLLKVEGDHVVRQAIEQGSTWNGGRLVQITAGLQPGDMIVTAPLSQLQPGNRVEMVEG